MPKNVALQLSPEGRKLVAMLTKAAGCEGMSITSIECRVSVYEPITFKVELMAKSDDVKKAVEVIEVTALGDPIVDYVAAKEASDDH